jgi:hypothetical protein
MLNRRRSIVALIGLVSAFAFAASAHAACVPGSRGPLRPVADTYANQSTTTRNYGSALGWNVANINPPYPPFWTKQRQHGYVRYRLPAIPPGCSLTQASLRISPSFRDYVLVVSPIDGGVTPAALYVAPAASSWRESKLTWKNQPGSTGPSVQITKEMVKESWTITPAVASLYSNGNTGLEIFAKNSEDPANQAWFSPNSREYLATRGNVGIPYLFVSWG